MDDTYGDFQSIYSDGTGVAEAYDLPQWCVIKNLTEKQSDLPDMLQIDL